MLTRDFVQTFLIGQVSAGKTFSEAKANLIDWLGKQSDITTQEIEMIRGDLGSYSVPGI